MYLSCCSCTCITIKICSCILDCKGKLQRYAFVQYRFDRCEHDIEIAPHGNSKSNSPFSRIKPSTIKHIKDAAKTKRPVHVLREIHDTKGGIVKANSGGDLPRNRQQVYNFNHSAKVNKELPTMPPGSSDSLAQVMYMCKQSIGSSEAFIQSIEAAPEPMCVLASSQQLADLQRFCTKDRFCVLSVDPTFNLGSFYVTPITYQNLHVSSTRGGNHPLFLGPVLIHQTKTFRPFHYFASTLTRLCPSLVSIKAFGTDGEPELIKAFKTVFTAATHLRCFNHIRRNIKDKLASLNIPQKVAKEFIQDIFGCQVGSHFECGLLDLESEVAFQRALKQLEYRWNNLEKSGATSPQFHPWFLRYKVSELVSASVRKKAGIKGHYTTNNSESINCIIKQETNWKENKLPDFIRHLQNVKDQQISELAKSVIGRGEWSFLDDYSFLRVPEKKWFKMTEQYREAHIKKVLGCPVSVPHTDSSESNSPLAVPVEKCGLFGSSTSMALNMWKKAEELVKGKGVVSVPWDEHTYLVKSSSSTQPHTVIYSSQSGGLFKFSCDEKCQMFKGFFICSHTVSAAHYSGKLPLFVEHYNANVSGPDLSAIAHADLPGGAGRKPGIPKRKRKRKNTQIESTSIRTHLQQPAAASSDCLVDTQATEQPPSTAPSAKNQPHLHGSVTPVNCSPSPSSIPNDSLSYTPLPMIPSLSNPAWLSTYIPPSSGHGPRESTCSSNHQPRTHCSTPINFTPCISSSSSQMGNFVSPSHSPNSCVNVSAGAGVVNVSAGGIFAVNSGLYSEAGTSIPTCSWNSRPAHAVSQQNEAISQTASNFVLKLKTKLVKVCQACRNGYDGCKTRKKADM